MPDETQPPQPRTNIFVEACERLKLETPPWIRDCGIELDPHQLVASYEITQRKRKICSLDKGLGKTLTTLSVTDAPDKRAVKGFTDVILSTGKGLGAFVRDIQKLYPERDARRDDFGDILQVVDGSKRERELAWRNRHARHFLCTYDGFLSDLGVRTSKHEEGQRLVVPDWVIDGRSIDASIWDEFHRRIRRHKSKTFETLKKVFKNTQFIIPDSGSAVSKGPQDLWAVLHLLDPKLWSSYWNYVATWNHIEEGFNNARVVGAPRADRVEKWRAAVRPYVFHCTKEMVGDSIVPKRRSFLDVQMPPWQKRLHDGLRNELFAETPDDDFIIATNPLAGLYRARLALICPRVLSSAFGVGQGMTDIWEDAQDSELSTFAIFTPFKAPIPILAEWLEQQGARTFCVHGGNRRTVNESILSAYRLSLAGATGDRPSVVIYTTKYGESWEIPECSYGYGLGYEYDNEDNKQAEDRMHRKISPRPVTIQYTRFLDSYDEDLITALIGRAQDREMMFHRWGEIRRLLK